MGSVETSRAREILVHLVDKYMKDADEEDTDLEALARHGGVDLIEDFMRWLDANEGG